MFSNHKNRIMLLYGHHQNIGGVVNLYQKFCDRMKMSRYKLYHVRVGRIQKIKLFNVSLFRAVDLAYSYMNFMIQLIRIKPAIIHLNPSLNKKAIYRDAVYLFMAHAIMKNIKIIMHIHGWEDQLASDFRSKGTFNFVFIRMINRANAVIVLASEFKERMMDIINSRQKISVMPTAVNVAELQNTEPRLPQNGRKILFLSRIIRSKGIFEIADSVEQIITKNQQTDIKFIFAGDGPDRKALENYIIQKKLEKYVEFAGYVRGHDKADLFNTCDIFLFPSYHAEGCPVAVLEAIASGLPIVSTDVAALKEIVINGMNGIIIEKQSVAHIVEAVTRLLNDSQLMMTMRDNNRKKAQAEFDESIIFQKLNHLYDHLNKC